MTNDGHEADLDLGHYERFLNVPSSKPNNVTSGRIYHVGVQFHPEYSSTVLNPHPLFLQFVKAAANK